MKRENKLLSKYLKLKIHLMNFADQNVHPNSVSILNIIDLECDELASYKNG